MWRFVKGAMIFAFALGLLVAIFTWDFSALVHFAGAVALFGLVSLIVAFVCGVTMKALFFLGWRFAAWLGKVARKLRH